MGRRPNTTPDELSADRLAWCAAKIAELGRDIAKARASKSWQALSSLHREQRAIRDQLDLGLERQRQAALAAAADARDVTPEERAQAVAEGARAATLEELEVFVSEWLTRHKYRLEVDDAGVMHLERADALRLVR